jgi:hypothetical protein
MHPSARRISSCSSVSTPSAVVIMPKLEPSTHDGANDRHAIVVPAKLVNERAINLRDPTRQPDSAIPRLYASARNRRRFSTDRRIGAFELRIADRSKSSHAMAVPAGAQARCAVRFTLHERWLQRGSGWRSAQMFTQILLPALQLQKSRPSSRRKRASTMLCTSEAPSTRRAARAAR